MSQLHEMTPHRETYLANLKQWFDRWVDFRFRQGQKSHGGDIDRKACFPNLGEELVDSLTYYHEHQNRLYKWADLLKRAHEGTMSKENAIAQVRQEILCELGVPSTAEVFDN